MFQQTFQQIGSVAAKHARTSVVSDESYNSFLRTKVEEKLYYLKDINTAEEFDELVDVELRRMSTASSEQPKNLKTKKKSFIERVHDKIVAKIDKMNKFKPQVATTRTTGRKSKI